MVKRRRLSCQRRREPRALWPLLSPMATPPPPRSHNHIRAHPWGHMLPDPRGMGQKQHWGSADANAPTPEPQQKGGIPYHADLRPYSPVFGERWCYQINVHNFFVRFLVPDSSQFSAVPLPCGTQKPSSAFTFGLPHFSCTSTVCAMIDLLCAQNINDVQSKRQFIAVEAEEMELLYQLADENGVEVPLEDTMKKDMVMGGPQSTQSSLVNAFQEAIQGAMEFKSTSLKVCVGGEECSHH